MDVNMDETTSQVSRERTVSIDSWRTFIPSRLEREDPFEDMPTPSPSLYASRPASRAHLTRVMEPPPQPERPSTRMSILRAATPLFNRASLALDRAATALGTHRDSNSDESRRNRLFNFLKPKKNNKRQRSPSPPAPPPPSNIPAPLRLNFLFVGARASGQTSLLFRARYGYFPEASAITRTVYEVYNLETLLQDRTCSLEMWDTSGAPDLNTVCRLGYVAWDAVFLCFDVGDKIGMYSIISWWRHAVENGFVNQSSFTPLVHLVGMKKDRRGEEFMGSQPGTATSTTSLNAFPTCCVGAEEALWQAKRIGAQRYLECSALTGEGMEGVFGDVGREAARRAILRETSAMRAAQGGFGERPKKKRRFLGLHGEDMVVKGSN